MGLLTILKKVKQKEKELRILILGLDNAGKTTILRKFNGEDINEICPTVGFNIKTLDYKGYVLNMWDIGGQKSIRTYWRNYFEQTDGIVWVVDSVDQWRLDECKRQLRELLIQEKLAGASLLILANKQDLAGALPMERIAELLDLRADDMTGRHWTIFACSAFTGHGLVEGIDWIYYAQLLAIGKHNNASPQKGRREVILNDFRMVHSNDSSLQTTNVNREPKVSAKHFIGGAAFDAIPRRGDMYYYIKRETA